MPLSLYLATVEITLGAIFHSARIPLTGYILSLHQAFCLARVSRQEGGMFTSLSTSTTVAILKTLAPAGKKITPMIAIIAQGFLFNMGTLCFGNNLVGQMVGAILLSFWGFVQPLLFATIIFGKDLYGGFEYLQHMIDLYVPGLSLIFVIACVVMLKSILAVGAVILANSSLPLEDWVHSKIKNHQHLFTPKKYRSLGMGLLKDFTSFWFLFSLIMVAAFSWGKEESLIQGFLTITQYLAVSILLFMVLRLINVQKLVTIPKDLKELYHDHRL